MAITTITRLRIIGILTTFKLNFWANPINNEICTSLFIGLARSESLNEVMFYICNMLNAHNPEPSRYFDGLSISSG